MVAKQVALRHNTSRLAGAYQVPGLSGTLTVAGQFVRSADRRTPAVLR